MNEFVLNGETIKLLAEFRGFEGGYIDPDDITLKVTDSLDDVILEVGITTHYQIEVGVYCYDFIVPDNIKGELTYEYKGYINNQPIVIKRIIEVVDKIQNTTQPTLYGI